MESLFNTLLKKKLLTFSKTLIIITFGKEDLVKFSSLTISSGFECFPYHTNTSLFPQ